MMNRSRSPQAGSPLVAWQTLANEAAGLHHDTEALLLNPPPAGDEAGQVQHLQAMRAQNEKWRELFENRAVPSMEAITASNASLQRSFQATVLYDTNAIARGSPLSKAAAQLVQTTTSGEKALLDETTPIHARETTDIAGSSHGKNESNTTLAVGDESREERVESSPPTQRSRPQESSSVAENTCNTSARRAPAPAKATPKVVLEPKPKSTVNRATATIAELSDLDEWMRLRFGNAVSGPIAAAMRRPVEPKSKEDAAALAEDCAMELAPATTRPPPSESNFTTPETHSFLHTEGSISITGVAAGSPMARPGRGLMSPTRASLTPHNNSLPFLPTGGLHSSRPGSSAGRRSSGGLNANPFTLKLSQMHGPEYHFPYEEDFADSASTFIHRLLRTLLDGQGTTLLTAEYLSNDARHGMLTESREAGKFAETLKLLAQELIRPAPSVIALAQVLIDASNWRELAEARRLTRLKLCEPVLSHTRPKLVREKLCFTTDREPGLIDWLLSNADSVNGDGWKSKTTASSQATGSPAPNLVCPSGSLPKSFVTAEGDQAPWVMVDLRPWAFCVSSYAIASHHPMHVGATPRNWVVEGSFDGEGWVILGEHNDDESLDGTTDFAVWNANPRVNPAIHRASISMTSMVTERTVRPRSASGQGPDGLLAPTSAGASRRSSLAEVQSNKPPVIGPPCSLFRIRSTGDNSMGTETLQLAALELYGRVLGVRDGNFTAAPARFFDADGSEKPTPEPRPKMGEIGQMPPEPAKKPGGKRRKSSVRPRR